MKNNLYIHYFEQVGYRIGNLLPEFRFRTFNNLYKKIILRMEQLQEFKCKPTKIDLELKFQVDFFTEIIDIQTSLESIFWISHSQIIKQKKCHHKYLYTIVTQKLDDLDYWVSSYIHRIKKIFYKNNCGDFIIYKNRIIESNNLNIIFTNLKKTRVFFQIYK